MVSTFVRHGGSVGSPRCVKQETQSLLRRFGRSRACRPIRTLRSPAVVSDAGSQTARFGATFTSPGEARSLRRVDGCHTGQLATMKVFPHVPRVLMLSSEVAREARGVGPHLKERELEARVMRFVRVIGITPEGKLRMVGHSRESLVREQIAVDAR